MKKALFSISMIILLFFSCKKQGIKSNNQDAVPPINPPPSAGTVSVQFQTLFNSIPFVYDKDYINSSGETFQINYFKFYVSNIALTNSVGNKIEIPNTYFLLKPDMNSFQVENIPIGSYSNISFLIGVDSLHNVSGVQKGALDPANALDMFWNWNTGYVFLMLNGTSPASTENGHIFEYHISGFKKNNFALQTITSNLNPILEVSTNTNPILHYSIELSEFFKNPQDISIMKMANVTSPGIDASLISKNYQDMFQLQSIEK